MKSQKDDVVRVAAGELIAMEKYRERLEESGIQARIVGEALTASFGPALSGSVELWVHAADAARAEEIILGLDSGHDKGAARSEKFPHPTDDPKPHNAGGHAPHPHHGQDRRGN